MYGHCIRVLMSISCKHVNIIMTSAVAVIFGVKIEKRNNTLTMSIILTFNELIHVWSFVKIYGTNFGATYICSLNLPYLLM